jgi:hypothetical protein
MLHTIHDVLTNPYVEGVLSNLMSLLVVGALVGAWYFLRRRRLTAFFGLCSVRRILVYGSRLDVPSGGSRGIDGRPRSFAGIATPDYEAALIADIDGFFGRFAPRILRWKDVPLFRWDDIEVEALVSPGSKGAMRRDGTVISIGSPGYNVVPQAVEEDLGAAVRFTSNNDGLEIWDGSLVDDVACCFVQRVVDPIAGQVAFYVAGPSAAGTTAAVKYLLKEWRHLAKRYSANQSFYVVLRVTSDDGEHYVVLQESPD